MKKRSDEDEIEAELAVAERLMSVPAVVEMLQRAGLRRSIPTVMADVGRGDLRMVKISGKFLMTVEREARRYVAAMIAAKDEKPRTPMPHAARELVDRLEREAQL